MSSGWWQQRTEKWRTTTTRELQAAHAASSYVVGMALKSHRYTHTRACLEWIRRAISAPILTTRFYRDTGYSLDDVLFVLDLADQPFAVLEHTKLGEGDLRLLHKEFKDLRHSYHNLRPSRTFAVLAQLHSPRHVLCCYHRTHHRKDIAEELCQHSVICPSNLLANLWTDWYQAWNTLNLINCTLLAGGADASKPMLSFSLSLDALNTTGRLERNHDSHWVTTFRMAMVDGRLMMEVTGQHWPSRFFSHEAGKCVTRYCHFCTDNIEFGPLACPHVELLPSNFHRVRKIGLDHGQQEAYLLQSSDSAAALTPMHAELKFDTLQKCPHCASEYMYSLAQSGGVESVCVKRWVDFGSCRTPWDATWLNLSRWTTSQGLRLYEDGACRTPREDSVELWRLTSLPPRGLSIRDVFEHATGSQDLSDTDVDSSDGTSSGTEETSIHQKVRMSVERLLAQVIRRSGSS